MAQMRQFDCHGLTDIGKVRDVNEDQFLIAELNKSMLVQQTSLSFEDDTRWFGGSQGQLLLVADGMGGHASGERASTVAVDTVAHYVLNTMPWFFRLDQQHEDDLHDELKAAMERCQASIQAEVEAIPKRRGMSTTLTLGYILWPRMYVVHVGDSRCYLLRSGKLEQATRDHTIAQQMVESGTLEPDATGESRWSHMLWNTVGGPSSELNPEVYKAKLSIGDTLLFCTDGVTRHLPDDQLVKLLGVNESAEQTCHKLVDAANEAGGKDNIAVVVARFLEEAPPLERTASAAVEDTTFAPAAAPIESPARPSQGLSIAQYPGERRLPA